MKVDRPNSSRRHFLTQSIVLSVGAAWVPVFRVTAASAQSTCPVPPNFPTSIQLYQQAFENWAGEIKVDDLWTCAPQTAADVVTLANWAHANGYSLRPRGSMHNWSPLTVEQGSACSAVILIDTTQHLTSIQVAMRAPAAVRVQTGLMMEALLTELERLGYGLNAAPAPGDVTVGGVLAIDAHGAGIPARGETRSAGHSYGSLSNLVLSITAVVWDEASGQYALRTFDRSHPHCRAFLTHLGRSFITEVTLQVAANHNLRCVSYVDIPALEMFARPGSSASRTFASYVESSGRAEAIWFPFTSKPWLKVWSVSPSKPLLSREVKTPYNYPFSDNVPHELALLADQIIKGNAQLTPVLGQMEYDFVVAGLLASQSGDIWGRSKNLQLYIKPTTLRVTANGYAIVTRRSNIQRVVNEFASFYELLVSKYQSRNQFPINGPVELRVTGLDLPSEVEIARAEVPSLSAIRPRPDHPEWDVAVWFNILTFPGTPYANQFYREFEAWIFQNYSGAYASARPEWSKGWAYTDAAAWSDIAMLTKTIPDIFRAGPGPGWDNAISTLDRYDPHRIFSNAFLDTLL